MEFCKGPNSSDEIRKYIGIETKKLDDLNSSSFSILYLQITYK